MFKKVIIIFSLIICACISQAQVWTKIIGSVGVLGNMQPQCAIKDTVNNVVYIGGDISKVNNTYYNGIMKFDGITFDTLQSGVRDSWGIVKSLQMFQNKLYVFGSFNYTGKYNCKSIGRWNGTSWDSVNFKPNQSIWSSDVYNNELYVSGWFDTIAGLPIKHVAKFDGTNWYDLSFPHADMTGAIKCYKNKIYVTSYTGVWTYDNGTWTNLADCKGDVYRHVYGMSVIDGLLYFYGRFNSLGGVNSKGIVAFDGTKWYGFGQGMSYSGYEIINNVQKIDGKIHVTGIFDKIEGIATTTVIANKFMSTNYAVLENNQWCLKSSPFDNDAFGVVKLNNELYIYGAFWKCGSDSILGFAKWNGGNSTVVCSNTFSITNTYVSISENIFFDHIKVYPNPVIDELVIEADVYELSKKYVTLYNNLGQVLNTLQLSDARTVLTLNELPSGIYFLKISDLNQTKTVKVIKN